MIGLLKRILPAALVAALVVFVGIKVFAAQTPPNTSIQNTASATYKDSSGNSYSTQSNTVTTVVQNAPSLTVTTNNGSSAGSQTVAPGQVVSDTYTLTNTGNGSGDFQLTTGASDNGVTGGTDSGSTSTVQYVYNSTTYTTVALLNTALSGVSVASGNTITVQVQYTLSSSATTPGTVITQLKSTLTYSGSPSAVTSASASNTYTDTAQADARMDLQKSASQGGSSPYNITYTINANNGGAFSSQAISSVTTLGFPNTGCLAIVDKIPSFNSTTASIVGTPSVTTTQANGFPSSGVTATVYYTTSSDGHTGWTTTAPAAGTATFVAVFLSVTSGTACLNSHTGTSAGSVTAGQAAVALSLTVTQPSGSGSANSNAYLNIATSIYGDNQSSEHIVGGGIPAGTANSGGAGPIYAANQGVNYPAAAPPTNTAGTGISNTVANTAHLSASVYNGPSSATPTTMSTLVTNSQATGSYDGSVAVSNNDDFTQATFTPAGFTSINSGTVPGTPSGNAYSSGGTINVPNALYNAGNADDSFTLLVTAPTGGWKVQLFPDNGLGTGPSATAYPGCTTAGASCTATVPTISSGSAIQYWAVYTAPSGVTAFTRSDASIVATSANDGTQTNNTHDEVYSGFIVLTKSANVTSTGCPTGTNPSLPTSDATGAAVCPGGVIQYTVDYRNIAVTGGTGNTEPATAFLTTKAGTLIVSEDGAAIGNTWAANTGGLNANAVDTPGNSGVWASNDVWSPALGSQAGASAFTCTVGGAAFSLGAGQFGTIKFSVTVK